MNVSESRILSIIDDIAAYSLCDDPGVTRFSYSHEDREARNYLIELVDGLGLGITNNTDAIGNLTFTYVGTDPALKPLIVGSHLDSVRNGGKFDGILGVVGGIEIFFALKDNKIIPKRTLKVMIFAEEEGSNFGTTMLGSKALVGAVSPEYLDSLTSSDGIPASQLIEEFGLNPRDVYSCKIDKGSIFAMIELHIEQGIILDRLSKSVGIVNAIAGMKTLSITIEGTSNHAGSTPMNLRLDPLVAASKLICKIEAIASQQISDTTVATVGYIKCEPNASNVIPKVVSFNVDVRDIEESGIKKFCQLLEDELVLLEKNYGFKTQTDILGSSQCVKLDPKIISTIEESAKNLTDSYISINSGAVHDAAMMSEITSVGMIFVPSKDGISHAPEEFTEGRHIYMGVQLLFNTVLKLCI